jgi:SAM-dependent methyltransferase
MNWIPRFLRRRPRARCLPLVVSLVGGRSGLEVGGPSAVFGGRRGILPVYPEVGGLDNCNFSSQTVWKAHVEGATFVYEAGRAPGQQYIAEASDLSVIPAARYGFLLSSHALEHCANPIKALGEWLRVIEEGGALVLLLPHREGTFDHRRPVTPLEHLVADAAAGVGEDDMTHLDEILALHDLALDPGGGTPEQFRLRSMRNVENRCFHQHVFDTRAAVKLLDHLGVQLLAVETMRPFHIIAVARKLPMGSRPDNRAFLAADAGWVADSVFAGDRTSAPQAPGRADPSDG